MWDAFPERHRGAARREPSSAVPPLHVAVLDEEIPYPPTSGKRIRSLNLILRLARRHHVAYLCHRNADEAEARQAAEFFDRQGIETVVVGRKVPRKSGPAFYARLAANLLSPLPYSVASHTSRALREAARAYAASHPLDLWQVEWTPYAEVLRGLDVGPRVLVAHNIESQIWHRYHQTEPNRLRRWYIARQWHKFESFEQRAFAEAARVVTVSEPDAELARSRFGARDVAVVDNGVDTSYFCPSGDDFEPDRLLFMGSLDWRPNLDAVGFLLDQVLPAIRALAPSARLWVVGRNPPEWLVCRVAAVPGAELAANVPDVRPFLRRCGVLVVPLRIGGGSRLKILEALAAGVPVVSTTVGSEGLELEPGRHLAVADTAEALARQVADCIRAPGPAREMAARGREVVLQRYDWDALAVKMEEVWYDAVSAGTPCAAGGLQP
jgi:glycosyltransferase involved in cell wall biosynthesis